nr:hypothetical protein [Tanacetum cinerariifolium]
MENCNGRLLDFSVSNVWEDIRMGGALVSWSNLVWFSQCIPRHSFVYWLAIHGKLKTHDNKSHGDRNVSLLCIFCGMVPDSHDHLFYDCNFLKCIREIARIHAEEELQIMIKGLDRSNETIAKYLHEYHQFASELPIERRIELISDLVRSKIFTPMGLKEEAERFKRKGIRFEQESVKKLRTSEEVPKEVKSPDEVPKEKVKEMMQLVPIEEVYVEALQVKHPIIDWKVHTEGQRNYWKIIRLGGSSASYQFFVDLLKHLDSEDLNQLWALVKESLSIRPPTSDKEMELWVELKRLYEPDDEDQLWTHTQNLIHAPVEWKLPPTSDKEMELWVELKRLYEPDDEDQLWTHTQNLIHAPVEWKLYDIYGVHHVTSKDKEIFMLVEKDYPLRKDLAIGMISYKLQVENYSKMENDLILKIYKIAISPR